MADGEALELYLDNPIWHALTNQQAPLALGDGVARRYPRDVAPFGAVVANNEEALASLAALEEPGGVVALFLLQPAVAMNAWKLLRTAMVAQMVYAGPIAGPSEPAEASSAITPLSLANVPAMLELVELTHPGPFLPRTIDLGRYRAIWQDGRLAAMVGERFHLPGYREISAVCTHPAFQRRGYARQLMLALMDEIQHDGDTPMLHVFSDNQGAITLYETLGFRRRATVTLSVLERA